MLKHFRKRLRFRGSLETFFGIDGRSLTLFRVGLALVILWDLATRSADLTLFYTDAGVLPRAFFLNRMNIPWMISIHLMGGSTFVQGILFTLQALCALSLLVGYRTRLMSVLSWFLMASLQRRNHMVLGGGDDYLRMMLFWSMFVPLGAYYSLDRVLDSSREKPPQRLCTWGAAALLLQNVIVYWTTAANKWRTPVWHDGTAVYYTLSLVPFARGAAHILLLYPSFLKILTHGTLWFEILGPILLFFPLWTMPIRTVATFCYLTMHLCFYSSMYLEIFPRISAVAMLPFLPSWFWDRVSPPQGPRLQKALVRYRTFMTEKFNTLRRRPLRWREPVIMSVSVAFFLVIILTEISARFTTNGASIERQLSPLTTALHLDQAWSMFSNSAVPSGWLVARGTLSNGTEVNLSGHSETASWAPPARALSIYKTERDREYTMNFELNVNQSLWPGYAAYLCRDWNDRHTPDRALSSVELFLMASKAPRPEDIRTFQRVWLMRTDCFNPTADAAINSNWTTPLRSADSGIARDRPPQFAGVFYPKNPAALADQVDQLLRESRRYAISENVVAILVPHAGLAYSGAVAATAYRNLSKNWDTVILLGPSHHMDPVGAALWSSGSFETPLGRVPIDAALAQKILALGEPVEDWKSPHWGEHSLEVELPFLQKTLPHIKIVPILVNSDDLELCRHLGQSIANIIRGKRVLLVISSDLSHYPAASLAPRIDRTTLAAIESIDPGVLNETARVLQARSELGLTTPFCGRGALLTGLYAAKALGAAKAQLLNYSYAGEVNGVSGDQKVVGYGAVAFLKGKPRSSGSLPELDEEAKQYLIRAATISIAQGIQSRPFQESEFTTQGEINRPAGVYVAVWKNGRFRGFAGSFMADQTLFDKVRFWARQAAFKNSRRPLQDVKDLSFRIYIVSELLTVKNEAQLQQENNGLFVKRGQNEAFLFHEDRTSWPNKDQFIKHLCDMAGLHDHCSPTDAKFFSFTDESFEGSYRPSEK